MTTQTIDKNQLRLTPKQNEAVQRIIEWRSSDKQCFVLAGYAGTGKTTLAKRISEKLGGVFCSYTAKAASVLMSKGVNACTIHSLLYSFKGRDEETGEMIWQLKNGDDGAFLIVDEYSMLSQKIIDDLKVNFKKILFLGDPMQLPPIKENEQILKYDYLLEEIHRQAEGNPIIERAHDIRQKMSPDIGVNDNGIFIVKHHEDLTDQELIDADQIIVGRNKTRRDLNIYMRELLGHSDIGNIPVKGDKLIFKQNNHDEGIVNGAQFTCRRNAYEWRNKDHTFKINCNGKEYKFFDHDVLGLDNRNVPYRRDIQRIDFGYAITCHSAQGSEYDSVVVFDESWGKQSFNWLYTAVTRAKKKVIVVKGLK